MDRIAGVVILYHPDEELSSRIQTYIGPIQKLYATDNSEDLSPIVGLPDSVEYLADQTNQGISHRLNQACSLAKEQGFQWILTMDQDSAFQANMLEKYFSCIQEFQSREPVAMFGVTPFDDEMPNDCEWNESKKLITSGSLVNLDAWSKLGGFEEKLFIDLVDYEYCFRANRAGWKTIQFQHIALEHRLGASSKRRSLISGKFSSRSLHPPIRMYYLLRNYLFVRKNYKKDFPGELQHIRKDLLVRLKNNFIYNKDRMKMISFVVKAVKDFSQNKMGKYSR